MKLSRVNIENFRSIKNMTIDFDNSCRVLVGVNESGKSNVLKALALLDPDRDINPNDLRQSLPDEDDEIEEAYVRFVFRYEDSDVNAIANKVFLTQDRNASNLFLFKENQYSPIAFIKTFPEVLYKAEIIENEKSHRIWAWQKYNDGQYLILPQWKKVTKSCPADFIVALRNGKSFKLADYSFADTESIKTEIPAEYLAEGMAGDVHESIHAEGKKLLKANHPETVFWQYEESNLLPTSVVLEEFMANPDTCLPLKHMFELAKCEDIKADIEAARLRGDAAVRNLLTKIATKTTAKFQEIWTEYKNVKFTLSLDGQFLKIFVSEKNEFEFQQRSDGFKRFISFLLMVSFKVHSGKMNNVMLLVDEPDGGLHPSGARFLRDELLKIAEKNKVIFTTHSIFMIDKNKIERHYIVRKKNEVTTLEEVGVSNVVDEEVLFQACGTSVFEIVKAQNIIFEGWKDKKLFDTALKRSKTPTEIKNFFKNVGNAHAMGASDLRRICPIFQVAERDVIILSDGDERAVREKKEFVRQRCYGKWYTFADLNFASNFKTGEDFINSKALERSVNKICANDSRISGLPKFGTLSAIDAIDSWLARCGITGDEKKQIIDKIKNHVFDHLQGKDIIDDYDALIDALYSKLQPS